MVNMLPSMLAPFLPVVWAGIAAAIWWRHVSSPWLFAITALLTLLGFQVLVSFLWDFLPQAFGSGYILESMTTEAQMQRHLEESNRTALIQAAIVLLIGFPFLWWLKSGFATQSA